ncbi:reverse transcriptase [Phytophthora megakarya]|uniref:Reverse transcriptase n=1 Tax=Phytophthora megakarya TaxID=4795 RepID=A0A225WG50_9STRA|nr:reverse transcriptase [Phytophthora megakarya]
MCGYTIFYTADGLPDAADQRSTGGSRVYTVVLLFGYGERILGGEDDGSGPADLWNRMPFGRKNAPQIYQRMIDNALYGFTRIPKMAGDLKHLAVFEAGEPKDPVKPLVLGRRSYIDDILVPADN